jgi:hypothetical protein
MYLHKWWGRPLGVLRAGFFLAALAAPASAASFSFTGTFQQDNIVKLFDFTLLSPQTITLQTLGYGGSANNTGGTNALGNNIAAGGFEPLFQVFNSDGTQTSGGTIGPDPPAPNCGLRTPDPGRGNSCQDLYAQILLGAGNYKLALTQNPNFSNGDLSAGFAYDSDPNFNNGFLSPVSGPGNGNWAVDILGADQASEEGGPGVPEPAPVVLVAASLLILGLPLRRTRRFKSNVSS